MTAKSARYGLAAVMLLGVLATTSEASAQYYGYGYARPRYRVARPTFFRDGLTFGFAVGGGVVSAEGNSLTGGGWLSARIGGMLAPNFALLFDTETVFFPARLDSPVLSESATGYAGIAGLAGQIFFDPIPLWLKAGGGFAYYGAQGDLTAASSTIIGGGFTVGLGIDLVKFAHPWTPFALSLETQATPMFFREGTVIPGSRTGRLVNWTVGVGFSWY